MVNGSFPWIKRQGRGVDHPPPSSAEVEGRVEVYSCSPSGPSWPVRMNLFPTIWVAVSVSRTAPHQARHLFSVSWRTFESSLRHRFSRVCPQISHGYIHTRWCPLRYKNMMTCAISWRQSCHNDNDKDAVSRGTCMEKRRQGMGKAQDRLNAFFFIFPLSEVDQTSRNCATCWNRSSSL